MTRAPSRILGAEQLLRSQSGEFLGGVREEKFHECHADGNSRGHLVKHTGRDRVRDLLGDFDPTVHRTRMHDQGVRGQGLHSGGIQTPEAGILSQRGQELKAAKTLKLDAQEVDDVGAVESLFHARGDFHPEHAWARGQECGRPRNHHAGSETAQHPTERTYHPRVGDIPDNRHAQPLDTAEVLTDRVQVEQGLGEVLMLTIPGIDNAAANVASHNLWAAGGPRPNHHHVGVHGVQGLSGIDERLALRN